MPIDLSNFLDFDPDPKRTGSMYPDKTSKSSKSNAKGVSLRTRIADLERYIRSLPPIDGATQLKQARLALGQMYVQAGLNPDGSARSSTLLSHNTLASGYQTLGIPYLDVNQRQGNDWKRQTSADKAPTLSISGAQDNQNNRQRLMANGQGVYPKVRPRTAGQGSGSVQPDIGDILSGHLPSPVQQYTRFRPGNGAELPSWQSVNSKKSNWITSPISDDQFDERYPFTAADLRAALARGIDVPTHGGADSVSLPEAIGIYARARGISSSKAAMMLRGGADVGGEQENYNDQVQDILESEASRPDPVNKGLSMIFEGAQKQTGALTRLLARGDISYQPEMDKLLGKDVGNAILTTGALISDPAMMGIAPFIGSASNTDEFAHDLSNLIQAGAFHFGSQLVSPWLTRAFQGRNPGLATNLAKGESESNELLRANNASARDVVQDSDVGPPRADTGNFDKGSQAGALSIWQARRDALYRELLDFGRRLGPDGTGNFTHRSGTLMVNGYPDFSRDAIHDVQIQLTGSRRRDFALANEAAGLSRTPKDFTWHHSQELGRMQLVPTSVHNKVFHFGGFWIDKALRMRGFGY